MNKVLAGLLAGLGGLACGGASAQVLGLGVGVGVGTGGSVSIAVPLPQALQNASRARNARTGAVEQPAPPVALQGSPAARIVLQPQSAPAQSGLGAPVAEQTADGIAPGSDTVLR